MAAAVNANFDRIDVELRKDFLEIGENARGKRLAALDVEERGPLLFTERSVEGENIVFLFVSGVVADGPIGDDEIRERIAGAPVVVTPIVNGLVEDDVHDGIWGITRAPHGGFLRGGQFRDDA